MARVIVTVAADRDVDEIFEIIGEGAGYAVAAGYDDEFNALYRRLGTYPASGAARPALGAGIRIGVVKPYVIVYRYDVVEDVVEILRILHGRRRLTTSLLAGAP